MRTLRPLLALALVAACSSTVTPEGGSTACAGGAASSSTAPSSTTSASSGGAPDAGPDPCPPGLSATRCDPECRVRDGGACPCDPLQAPNCPAGWWKVCCDGDGAPCEKPDLGPGVDVQPACGPGPTPAWCVTSPMSCL